MKKAIISLIILILIIIGLILIFNKQTIPIKEEGKITVIASIYPVYDFAKEIAGDKANVSMLLSPGVEIHDYEPTPQDMINIQSADLFLYMSNDLEPWAETLISGLDNSENIKTIADGIELIENEEFEKEYLSSDEDSNHEEHEEHEKYDTHIWLDPLKAIEMVKNIEKQLSEADPENAQYYKENANRFIIQLETLDKDFDNAIAESSRNEIAFGGPFSYAYFIKRYNLEFVTAYDSCGESGEPSIQKIFNVIEEIKKENIPVIFYKELSSGNIAKTISEETGAKLLEFNSLHSITQKQLNNGETYISIMYKNLENLKRALK